MNGHRNRRRQLVVQPELQRKIILQATLFPIAALGAGTVITGFFCARLAAEASAVEANLPSLTSLFVSVLSFTAAMAGVSLYLALRTSHRVGGPSYRITQTLKHLRNGDYTVRARLRTGDLLTEIADELNGALDELEAREVKAGEAASPSDGKPVAAAPGAERP